ncbi:MAG: hypothetical protein J1F35_08040 [Erysipelotrichales bacterium]|nr:hypothetical protein [Erysipelotrichales bacterium]
MKTLVEYISEAKKPTLKDIPQKDLQTWFGRYMDQWCVGGYEKSNDGDCADIKPLDEQEILDIIHFVCNALPYNDPKKVCQGTLNSVLEEKVKKTYDTKDIDIEYNFILDAFTKRRLDIMISAWSMSKSDKASIVSEIYLYALSTLYVKDQDMLLDIWPEDEE